MEKTPRARVLHLAAVLTLLHGLLTQHVGSGLLGFLLLVLLHHEAQRTRHLLDASHVTATRSVPQERFHADDDVPVTLEVRGTAPLHATLRDHPPSADPVTLPLDEVPHRSTYEAILPGTGPNAWGSLELTLTDRFGLWTHTTTHAADTTVHAHAHRDDLRRARRLAGQDELTAQDLAEAILDEVVLGTLRPYAPGDRLRDIDWKRTAYFQELLTRPRDHETQHDLLLVLDASPTMTTRHDEGSPREHAMELALQLVELARARDHGVGLLIVHGDEVVDSVAPQRDAANRIARLLEDLPQRVDAHHRRARPPLDEDAWEHQERGFLHAVTTLLQPRSSAPKAVHARIQRALQGRSPGQATVVALTDLATAPRSLGRTLHWVHRRGYTTVLALYPSPFHEPPRDAGVHAVEEAFQRHRDRERQRRALRRAGLRLTPLTLDADLTHLTQEDAP